MDSILENASSMMDGIIVTSFMLLKLGIHKKKLAWVPVFMVAQYLTAQFLSWNVLLQVAVMIGINIVFSCLCLGGKYSEKIIWSILCISMLTAINVTMLPLLAWIFNTPLETILMSGYKERVIFIGLCQLLHILGYSLVLLLQRNPQYLKKKDWLVLVFIITSFTFGLILIMEINIELALSNRVQNMVFSLIVIMIGIFLGYLYLANRMSAMNENALRLQYLENSINQQRDIVAKAGQMQKNTETMNHDMKHYAIIWKDMIEGRKYEDAQKSINSFINAVESNYNRVKFIDNVCINAILYNKKKMCDDKKIPIVINISTAFSDDKDEDIAVLLSNILDNAIQYLENVTQTLENGINVSIFKENMLNHIIISNYITASVLENNLELKTTKKNKAGHGLGLQSVRKIVEKYDADIHISEERDKFIIHVVGL